MNNVPSFSTARRSHFHRGFTIVELLVVVVVIAILASITIVAYNGVTRKAGTTALQSDLKNASTSLEIDNVKNGSYPENGEALARSEDTKLEYSRTGTIYCMTASSNAAQTSYYIDSSVGRILEGTCSGHIGYSPSGSLATISALTAGYSGETNYTCAVASSKAYCWGSGNLGKTSGSSSSSPAAVDTSGPLSGKTVTAISAPAYDYNAHTCVIASGQAYCWGNNGFGQLGDGSTNYTSRPTTVVTGALIGKTVTAISAGYSHTCAAAPGQTYCWGTNYDGRLGNGTTTSSTVPVALAGTLAGKTVTSISTGGSHSCATFSGQAYCWGGNSSGQIGNGTTTNSNIPVALAGVLAGKSVTSISTGSEHTCTVASGQAYCWGENSSGQIGNGTTTNSNVPVVAAGALAGKTVTAISAGHNHTCAVASGQVYCWGNNSDGQLGTGNTTNSNVPIVAAGALAGKTVTDALAGGRHSCAIASGQAYCWGNNSSGQLGTGNTTSSSTPVAVLPISL